MTTALKTVLGVEIAFGLIRVLVGFRMGKFL
jgi:hypothetical protein